ncbi:MAG: hypothetical protein K8R92_00815 [Planctomycetes bacterium]|nr:hypothetical protein [Planctomycetota bacterium]
MSDLFAKGNAWLTGQCQQSLSRAVTYQRGEASASLLAMVTKSTYEEDDGNGLVVLTKTRDYVFPASSLVFASDDPVAPQEGDRIVEVDPDTEAVLTFEVVCPAGQPAWNYCDTSRLQIRVHCKEAA